MRVLPDARTLDKAFDYLVPAELAGRVGVGTVVRVPLHGRRVRGWVLATAVTPPPGVRLRPLAAVVGDGPAPEVVALATWAAWRWAGPRSALLRAATQARGAGGRAGAEVGAGAHARACHPSAGSAPPGPADLAGEAMAAGRAVVRLPPAADPAPLVAEVARRAGPVLVVAASLARAEHVDAHLRAGGLPAAVGARAAAWAPVAGLGAVVVVDAHDEALQEERAPTWEAWAVAAERAARAGVPAVVISACPRPEQLAWGSLVRPSRAEERAGWPAVVVVDRRREDPRAGLYSARLVELLRAGDPVACILNRRGRARLLACARCRELARCERCGGAAQLAEAEELSCRRCRSARPVVCQACGSQRLAALRVGVARAAGELAALARRPVGEVTAATADLPAHDVLVGTEALLHRLPDRWRGAVVAFLDFDQELLAPRFGAGQQALALLARAARAVGPRAGGGRVMVQTRLPGHEVLAAAVHADPGRFSGPEAARRAALGLPPAAALALVSGDGAAAFVAALPAGVEVLGPDAGRYLVRAPDPARLADALAATPRPAARLRVEVDPRRV